MACSPPASGIPLLGCCDEDADQRNRLLRFGGCGYTGFQPFRPPNLGESIDLYLGFSVEVIRQIDAARFASEWTFPDWAAHVDLGTETITGNDFGDGGPPQLFRPPGIPYGDDPTTDEAEWSDQDGLKYDVVRSVSGLLNWVDHWHEFFAFAEPYQHRTDELTLVEVNMRNLGLMEASIITTAQAYPTVRSVAASTKSQTLFPITSLPTSQFAPVRTRLLSIDRIKVAPTGPYCGVHSRASSGIVTCQTTVVDIASFEVNPLIPISADFPVQLGNFEKTSGVVYPQGDRFAPPCCSFAP